MILTKEELIHINFQVYANKRWSKVFQLATWALDDRKGSYKRQSDPFGVLDIDVFTPTNAINIERVRVMICSDSDKDYAYSINLTGLFASFLVEPRHENHVDSSETKSSTYLKACFFPAPVYVQYPVEKIGRRICSPTSCAMAVSAFGYKVIPEKMAGCVYDVKNDIYGNWSMNMAAVSQLGFRAVVRHFNGIGDLTRSIERGVAVVVSVKTSKEKGFENALQTYSQGHLMLVTGFVVKNKTWYVTVHDPADDSIPNAVRKYTLEEFCKYWSGVGYEIEPLDQTRKEFGMKQLGLISNWMPDVELDLQYASDKNVFGEAIYTQPFEQFQKLRIGTLRKLSFANWRLKSSGYSLKVWDAFRPVSVQERLWESIPNEKYVANPQIGSKHNRGCALDVTLVNSEGEELEMPTNFDEFTEKARFDRSDLSANVKKNLEVLQKAFLESGFLVDESEWWHFNDSDWKVYQVIKGNTKG